MRLPRFTIWMLMLAVAVVAIAAWIIRPLDTEETVEVTYTAPAPPSPLQYDPDGDMPNGLHAFKSGD
jgi:hypothetical protein